MTSLDVDMLQQYVGAEETRTDTVRETAVEQFRCTLEDYLADETVGVPPGFHWTLFPPLVPTSELGEDGHPRKLGLLPELPRLSRMWAGGEITFHTGLGIGDTLVRRSRVSAIKEKSGASGQLLFVTLSHDITSGGQTVISETQTLVYRPASRPAPRPDGPAGGAGGTPFSADSRLLFRYSALTFNTHRIHYDRDYATREEGYPELVVHGPLQATLLMNLIASGLGHARMTFSYRGTAPLYAGERASLCREGKTEGQAMVQRAPGDITMKASFCARQALSGLA